MDIELENNINTENLITPFKYILITDNKGNREFTIIHNKKQRIGKKHLDLSFYDNKKLNSFWEIEGQIAKEISSKDYFRENICIYLLIKSKMKKLNMIMRKS